MMMDESGSLTKKFRRDHHVRAKKAVLHEEKIEDGDLDPDLQFMQDMLNQHKKNNTKLFEKIKVVTKKNRKILTGKRLSMTESDEEMKKFQDEMGKRFSLKFPVFSSTIFHFFNFYPIFLFYLFFRVFLTMKIC